MSRSELFGLQSILGSISQSLLDLVCPVTNNRYDFIHLVFFDLRQNMIYHRSAANGMQDLVQLGLHARSLACC